MDRQQLDDILESNFSETDDVYIRSDWDEESYIRDNIESIRKAKCDPFKLTAKVAEPGFHDKEIGDEIEGYCIAHQSGHWLVYVPEENTFYCFWGVEPKHVAARGVAGNALYCWTA